jgi:hypothetical protein
VNRASGISLRPRFSTQQNQGECLPEAKFGGGAADRLVLAVTPHLHRCSGEVMHDITRCGNSPGGPMISHSRSEPLQPFAVKNNSHQVGD